MANELQLQSKAGWAVYAIVRNFIGQVWNGSSWEAYATGNLGNYDIPMTEQGTASGFYVADFPAAIAAATHGKPYGVAAYRQLGGSPAEGDTLLGTDEIAWKLDERGVVLADSADHGGAASVLALKKVTVVSDGNDNAVTLTGSGSGDGLHAEGSGTGAGIHAKGRPGLDADGAASSSSSGIRARGGLYASGIHGVGGSIAGAGIYGQAQGAMQPGATFEAGSGGKDIDADILNTLRDFYEAVVFGTVDDVSPTALAFETDLTEVTDDHYKAAVCVFRTGALKGQTREVAAYDGTLKKIAVALAYTDAPGNGDTFAILGLIA